MKRVEAISAMVREDGADAVLLTSEVSLIYATGVTAMEGACIVFSDDTAVFITDGRYIEVAEQRIGAQGITVLCRSSAQALSHQIAQVLGEKQVRRLFYEDAVLTVAEFARLRAQLGDVKDYLPASDRLGVLRACKSAEEIAAVTKAQRIAEQAYARLLPELYTGITEREAAARLNYYMALAGSEKPSFDTIMLFGENTSKPHGTPSDRGLRAGDFITMDFGAVCDGYHSDMTRTVAYGSADDEMRKVYDTVLRAQAAAMSVARAGLRCSGMHKAAMDVIAAAGYGEYFTHALGHTVGLEIHEYPVAGPHCDVVLRDGMIMTDEPGIYIAGRFGVRIEDMLVIAGDTPQNLTEAPKELRILPAQSV